MPPKPKRRIYATMPKRVASIVESDQKIKIIERLSQGYPMSRIRTELKIDTARWDALLEEIRQEQQAILHDYAQLLGPINLYRYERLIEAGMPYAIGEATATVEVERQNRDTGEIEVDQREVSLAPDRLWAKAVVEIIKAEMELLNGRPAHLNGNAYTQNNVYNQTIVGSSKDELYQHALDSMQAAWLPQDIPESDERELTEMLVDGSALNELEQIPQLPPGVGGLPSRSVTALKRLLSQYGMEELITALAEAQMEELIEEEGDSASVDDQT